MHYRDDLKREENHLEMKIEAIRVQRRQETAKMGLNMTLEQAQAQSASISSVCQAQVQGYQALQRAIQTFAEDTENLQGKAYDSARNNYQLVLLPLA